MRHAIVEAPEIDEVRLSPDGRWVVYRVTRGSVADNQLTSALLLQALDEHGGTSAAPIVLERRAEARELRPQWCPDGTCLTYFSTPSRDPGGASTVLMRYEIASRTRAPIVVRGGDDETKTMAVGDDYQWSPDGRFMAFTTPLPPRALDPRTGVHITAEHLGRLPGSPIGLYVLEVASGTVERISPDTLGVWSFDWSPDGRSLAVGATPNNAYVLFSDVFVIDCTTRSLRAVVTQPGWDANPTWSPDGKWIAFSSHYGVQYYYGGWPAVVSADGGSVVQLAGPDDAKVHTAAFGSPPGRSPSAGIFWTPDSQAFYYGSYRHLSHVLVKADIASKRVAEVIGGERAWADQFSLSADRTRAAFTRESIPRPPELVIQSLPDGEPRQATRLSSGFPLATSVRVDRLDWPSTDKKFTVHGVLVTPQSAWRDGHVHTPLPTLIWLWGGPEMVKTRFGEGAPKGALLAMVAKGYAVLAPNTRGRGGYGAAFERGIRDSGSVGRLPFADLNAGLDYLVQQGIADANRVGVLGHSYGGYLTAYTITQTTRFRAAVVIDGGAGHLDEAIAAVPGTTWALLARDLHGIRNPYDPTERERLIAQSPTLNMDRVATPTLLLYGGAKNGMAETAGRFLFAGLQRFQIPSEFLLYEEGHNFRQPAAMVDAFRRMGNWFDYWVRDKPYPDAERAREYDAWRAARTTGSKR